MQRQYPFVLAVTSPPNSPGVYPRADASSVCQQRLSLFQAPPTHNSYLNRQSVKVTNFGRRAVVVHNGKK